MKKKWWITLSVIVVVLLAVYFTAGYFLGNIPVASTLLGTNKPRDLGVEMSIEAAYKALENMDYPTTAEELRAIRNDPSIFTTVTGTLTNEEASSMLSTGLGDDFPFRLTQIKFGPGGSVEAAGVLYTADFQAFLGDLGVSSGVLDTVMSYVKNATSLNYYMNGTCSILNNRIDLQLDSLQIGRINIPESVVQDNLGSIGSYVSNALTSRGYNIRKMTISEGKVDLDMDRPLDSLVPWLDFVQY